MDEREYLKLSPAELVDRGICPSCLNRKYHGAIYGDDADRLLYADGEIECFFVGNPRAAGHMCIASVAHYHDMSEAPDRLNEKMIRFARQFMIILREEFGCERVYLCTMCDGPMNHYHLQLIPPLRRRKARQRQFCQAADGLCFRSPALSGGEGAHRALCRRAGGLTALCRQPYIKSLPRRQAGERF